ncbi:hypothetical protein FRC08_003548 [Ceratobasidium sp. 394]|nr:hypothetical protein FRC08_003548 [Ceratobasidium sp. 394]
MSSSEIIGLLTLHQCPDITGELHLDQCGKAPVFGGGFGDIYKGVLRGGQRVAIKCARLFPQQDEKEGRKVLKRTARELYSWSRFQHENVLQLFGLAQFREQVAMVSPWMDNEALPAYITRNPSADRYRLSIGICEGVVYLHENGIAHGDIKGGNVLISDGGIAKLADFGCTELKGSELCFTTTTSTEYSARWAAPEILMGGVRGKPADVYALGMTLLEVVTGTVPFSDIPNNMAVISAICFGRKIPERPKEFPSFEGGEADSLWELIVRTWAYSDPYRPESSVVKHHVLWETKELGQDQTRPMTATRK